MFDCESQLSKRFRDNSQNQARVLLGKMDRIDPLWMERVLPSPKWSFFDLGDSIPSNFFAQAVGMALVVCLLISASSARVTAKAVTLAMQTDEQTEQSGPFSR